MLSHDETSHKFLFDLVVSKAKMTNDEIVNLLREKYSNLNKMKGDKKLNCLFPNCNATGVDSSHLFAKSFLQTFHEKGKFYVKSYYPKTTAPNFNYSIEEMGISEVMTFPGFCSSCEKKFSFERKKKFIHSDDYFLQLLRTVCYEKRIVQTEIINNEIILKSLREVSTNNARPFFSKGSEVQLKEMKGANDIENFFEYKNGQLRNDLKNIDNLYNTFLKVYNCECGINIINLKLGALLPVFAGYVGNLTLRINDEIVKSNVVLNIHPMSHNETEVFFIDLNGKLGRNHFSKLNLEELLQLFGEIMSYSNSWIVNKKYWGELNETTKNEILRNRELDSKASLA